MFRLLLTEDRSWTEFSLQDLDTQCADPVAAFNDAHLNRAGMAHGISDNRSSTEKRKLVIAPTSMILEASGRYRSRCC